MKIPHKFLFWLAGTTLAPLLAASAATFTWDGGGADATASTKENWAGDVAPSGNGDLIFSGTSAIGNSITWAGTNVRTLTFDATSLAYTFGGAIAANGTQFTVAGVDAIANNSIITQVFNNNLRVFNDGTKTFNANAGDLALTTVTFRGDGMFAGQTNTLALSGSKNGTISGAINEVANNGVLTSALTKAGTGTWTLSGASTYLGMTTVSNGTLAGIGASAFGSTSGISIAALGTLSLRGDSNTSFVKAAGGAAYTVSTSASAATINVDQATVAGTSAKIMTIGTLNTSSTAAAYQMNFTGANNTSLNIGTMTGPASTGATPTVTINNTIAGGGSLTLAGYTSGATSNPSTLVLGGAGSTNITGAISPSATSLAVTKSGSGAVTYSGANTYTGLTTVSNGTLTLANATGESIQGGIAISGSGRILLSANNQIKDSAVITWTGTGASNTGRFQLGGFSETVGGLDDSSANGGTQTKIVEAAPDGVSNAAATLTLDVANAASYTYSGFLRNASGGGVVNSDLSITKTGLGTQILTGAGTVNYSGVTTVNGGILELLPSAVNNNSAISLGVNGTIRFNASADITRAGSIAGSGGLEKTGGAIFTLTGAKTYTGNTTISDGILRAGGKDILSDSSVVVFSAGASARYQLQGFNDTIGGLASNGGSGARIVEAAADNTNNAAATLGLNVATAKSFTHDSFVRDAAGTATNSALSITKSGNGTQVFSGDANFVSYSGATVINGGVLEFSGTNSVAANSAITVNTGSTVKFSGDGINGVRSKAIDGLGSVTKAGTGTVTFSGANSYTGPTSVDGGKLVIGVGGIGSIISNVSVASGAILGGSGMITGNVTLAAESLAGSKDGGNLEAGNSPGVLTVVGTATHNTGSIFSWELADNVNHDGIGTDGTRGTDYDGLTTTNLTVATGAIFRVILTGAADLGVTSFWGQAQEWNNIFSVSGTTSKADINGLFNSFQVFNGTSDITMSSASQGSFTFNGSSLTWSAVPEPTTALAGVLLVAGLMRRRRS